jgi:hypothetical protein
MRHGTLGSALLFLLAAVASPVASASSWYFLQAGSEETRYFFDAESIERSKSTVVVWVKAVQVTKAEDDGSWSGAMRWRFQCTRRTLQSLSESRYNKDGVFLRAFPKAGSESAVVPESTGEAIMKIVCKSNFPYDKSGADYFRLKSNDVYQATRSYADLINSQSDSAPK